MGCRGGGGEEGRGEGGGKKRGGKAGQEEGSGQTRRSGAGSACDLLFEDLTRAAALTTSHTIKSFANEDPATEIKDCVGGMEDTKELFKTVTRDVRRTDCPRILDT